MENNNQEDAKKIEFIETLISVYKKLSFEDKVNLNDLVFDIYKKYNEKINKVIVEQNDITKSFVAEEEKNNNEKTTEKDGMISYDPVQTQTTRNFLKSILSLSKIKLF